MLDFVAKELQHRKIKNFVTKRKENRDDIKENTHKIIASHVCNVLNE